MPLWSYWLILIFLLTIVELSTNALVCVWFIASALVSLLLSLVIDDLFILIGVFVILGVILLLTTRKLLNKFINPNHEKTNLDRVIGMVGICTEEIKKNVIGEVKVDGKKWSAISDKKINVGDEVIIDKIDGVKLVVRKEVE